MRVHPNDLGFQRMADRLAPTVASILHKPPPVLVDDRAITLHSPADFPKTQLPVKITKNAPHPIANLQHAKSVEAFTIRMDQAQENTTHHLHHGHACAFDDAANPKSYGMAQATDAFLAAGYAGPPRSERRHGTSASPFALEAPISTTAAPPKTAPPTSAPTKNTPSSPRHRFRIYSASISR